MKNKPLTSEEQLTPKDWKKIAIASVNQALEEDRDQAYTSLIKGIEGMKKYPVIGSSDQQIADSLWRNDTLNDIIENVVKQLYGKS